MPQGKNTTISYNANVCFTVKLAYVDICQLQCASVANWPFGISFGSKLQFLYWRIFIFKGDKMEYLVNIICFICAIIKCTTA